MSEIQDKVPKAPKGKERLKWLGPGFLWMVSAAGSGELLFSPRVGALYGYALLWALFAAVMLKWFINREIGRYTVCSGATVIDGFRRLPGPKNWALYFILIPQLFVAVSTIAGLAGSAGTALVLVLPGDIRIWTILSILISSGLVFWGRFKAVELVATVLALLLAVAGIVAAGIVFAHPDEAIQGMVPSIPENMEYGEILPWLGFMLSGAAGMIWYSYWIQKKGYGAAGNRKNENEQPSVSSYSSEDKKQLKGWIKQMTLDNNIAVIGTLVITIAFLVLGTELLRPKGLVPEENKVAEVLGQLLGQLWGPIGFWFMVLGVFIGFWSTILSDQDGFGRMFAGGTRLLLKPLGASGKWVKESFLNNMFILGLVTILPIALYLWMGEPVQLLKIAGAIEAAHIPVLAILILFLNHKKLPPELRPSLVTTIFTALAGLFFAVFAVIYLLQLMGVVSIS